jgi:hypothetical protein
MGASIENAKQPVVEQAIKGSWAWLLSYLLALVSLSASIATGVPGLRGLSGSAQALAWFHVSVFLSVFFIIVGSAIQIHLELRQVHSQLGVVRRAERSVEAELTNIQQVLSSDIRCEYVGDEEAAVRHLVGRFKQEALQAIRGTLVRSDEDHGQYAAAIYREIEDSLRDFLRRPETYLEEIVGPKADKKLVDAYINAAAGIEKDGGDRVGWFRLLDETPILNFVILTYKESGGAQKYEEVLFGGSRYGSETGEAVFRSKDPRVVHEFQDLYDVLRRSSARTEAKGVHERSVRASVIHQGWDQARLYKLMNGTEVCEAGQEGYNEGDLRISTTFFIGYFELRKEVLLGLSAK